MVFAFQNNARWGHLIWALVAAVFIADLLLPQQFDIVFAYLLAHFLAIFFTEKSDVVLLAVITTTLTFIGAALQPHEAPWAQVFLERLPPVISFWAAAFFVVKFIILRETEEQQKDRFQTLFQYATNGLLLTNQQGQIIMANPALARMFGYKNEELIGQQVEMLIPHEVRQRHQGHREDFHQMPRSRDMGTGLDLYGLKKDGSEFPLEVSLSPFRTKEGAFVVAFLVDNTYRKNVETSLLRQKQELSTLSTALKDLNESLEVKVAVRTAELEQAKNELAQALSKERELGELKSRFVSMASHEFRTPLTSVLSSAGLVDQYADRGDLDNIKKHAARIKHATEALNSILSEFLSLGRLEEGRVMPKMEAIHLPTCLAETHADLKNIFKTGQTLQYTHTGRETVHMDGTLLRNIMINLISNAVKYSAEGQPLEVHSSVSDDDDLRISVRDYGIGVPEAEQKNLFERFFRASNTINIQGTGLGLHIVQRYADLLGGRVEFKSVPGEGSTFWIDIPAKKPLSGITPTGTQQ
jgi:PAS domain S-box-containing protein